MVRPVGCPQDSDDEDVEQEIEDTIEQLLDPKRSVKNISAVEAAAVSAKSGIVSGAAKQAQDEAAKTSGMITESLILHALLTIRVVGPSHLSKGTSSPGLFFGHFQKTQGPKN